MRIQQPTLYLEVALGLLFCLQFTACGSQGIPGSQGTDGKPQRAQVAGPFSSSSQSTTDFAVPPVILHDPAASGLEVVFNVNMGGYGADREQTTIGLSFLSHGNVVQLAGYERLMCNGGDMSVHQQYALFQLADAPTRTLEGKTMNCTYSVGNVSTTFSFTVPRAPVIRSPQDGAHVPRSAHTVVTYDYNAQGGKLLGIVALGPGAKTLATHLDAPGQVTLDTSAFPTGAGSLSLTQLLDLQVTQTRTPFKSLGAGGTAMTMVTVTWV